jgi:quercetin dioxygenase-like cupin family protein
MTIALDLTRGSAPAGRALHVSYGAIAALGVGIVLAAIGIGALTAPLPPAPNGIAPHSHDAMIHAATPGEPAASTSQRPATIVKPVSCEKLPNVPGKSLTTVSVEFPPNAHTPRHRHPGSVMAFVTKGKVRSQLGGGPAEVFGVGQSWFEPPGTIHMFAENASTTEPAAILAIFVADDDCGPLTIFE